MAEFCCERCGYKTKYKHNLLKHLRKQVPCDTHKSTKTRESLLQDLLEGKREDAPHTCEQCGSKFKHRSGLSRHRSSFHSSVSHINLSNNVQVTGNNNNTITVNLNGSTLRDFDSEEVKVTLSRLDELLRKHPIMALLRLVEDTHTENPNWFISNYKDGVARIWKGGEWKVCVDGDRVIHEVFNKHYDAIEDACGEARETDKLPQAKLHKWDKQSSTEGFEEDCKERIKRFGYEKKPRRKVA